MKKFYIRDIKTSEIINKFNCFDEMISYFKSDLYKSFLNIYNYRDYCITSK